MKRKSTDVVAKRMSVGRRNASDVEFKEAVGKTVERIRFVSEPLQSQAFELQFTDGTLLFLEPQPRLFFRARYLQIRDGKVSDLRDFGVLPTH